MISWVSRIRRAYAMRMQKRWIAFVRGDSLLELGAGETSHFHHPQRTYWITGLDIYEPSLIRAKQSGQIDDYLVGDVRQIDQRIPEKAFDSVSAFDLIEHLPKSEGYTLIKEMERIARKRILIFTPNGFIPQPPSPENPFQEHRSGWTYTEMKRLGFQVIGMKGYRRWRGLYGKPTIKPDFLGKCLCHLSQWILDLFGCDHLAYAIFCYKDLDLHRSHKERLQTF